MLTLTSSVFVISVVRLVVLSRLEDYDVTWNYVNAAIWSAAEPSMGIIAACIPSLRPMVSLIWKGSHRGPTVISESPERTNSSNSLWPVRGKEHVPQVGPFARLEDRVYAGDHDGWSHDAMIHGGKSEGTVRSDEVDLEELHSNTQGIRVKKEVTVTSHAWDYMDRLF